MEPNPGPVLANFGVDSLRFLAPVKAGDSIRVTLTVKQITPRRSADYDVLTLVAKTWPTQ